MEDRSSMGLNDDTNAATNDSGVTGGPDGPDSGLPTPGQGGAGGPLSGSDCPTTISSARPGRPRHRRSRGASQRWTIMVSSLPVSPAMG